MLSFDKGRPIAKIKGGPYKNKIIYIDNEESDSESSESSDYGDYFGEKLKKNNLKNEIHIKKGHMLPIPNIDTREVCYIAGPSGAGKSTWASNYIEIFKKIFPKKKIILFSRKPKDHVLDKLKPLRFIIDESLISDPIDIISELKGEGALIIFDDTNTIQDEKIKKAVSNIMNDILEVGRSSGIYCIVTSHLLNPTERKDSRTIWNEAHSIVIFPKSGNRHAMNYSLKNYCGFDNKLINKLLNLKSRWIMIYKQYPNYVIYDKGVLLL